LNYGDSLTPKDPQNQNFHLHMFSINLPADRAGELLKTLKSAKSRLVSNF